MIPSDEELEEIALGFFNDGLGASPDGLLESLKMVRNRASNWTPEAQEIRRSALETYSRMLRATMGNEIADAFKEKMAKGWNNLMKWLDEEDEPHNPERKRS